MASSFEYGVTESRVEYDEAMTAKAEHEGDPVAQLLIEAEAGARMNLGVEISRLRSEADRLSRQAAGIVSLIDQRGLDYSPNALGEIQGHHVDVLCATVWAAKQRLEQVQHSLRDHLEDVSGRP